MKVFSLLTLTLLWTSAVTAQATPVTISFGAQQAGSALGLADGTELATESLVRFGYFTLPLEDVAASSGDFSLLNANFIELAAARVGYFGGSTLLDEIGGVAAVDNASSPYEEAPGLFGHALTYNPEALGLLSARYYLWVVNTPELAGATQHGLFSDADWKTPSFGEAIFDVSTVNPQDPLDLFVGDRGPEESSISGFGHLNKLRPLNATFNPVPEPGLGLLMLAAASILGLRRRRPSRFNP